MDRLFKHLLRITSTMVSIVHLILEFQVLYKMIKVSNSSDNTLILVMSFTCQLKAKRNLEGI